MPKKFKKTIKLKVKIPKSRDLIHLGEITNGTGAGAHKSDKDYDRKKNRKIEKESEGL